MTSHTPIPSPPSVSFRPPFITTERVAQQQRAAEYVGEGETSAWFGGPPTVFVIYLDTRTGAAVEVNRVIPRDS